MVTFYMFTNLIFQTIKITTLLFCSITSKDCKYLDYLRNWLEIDNIIIVERGNRDATDLLINFEFECHIPPIITQEQRQLSTEQANKLPWVTKTRWIVKARNGHIKNIFKFFKVEISINHVPNIAFCFRIVWAIINKYFSTIYMQGATAELVEISKQSADYENAVKARVEAERLHL